MLSAVQTADYERDGFLVLRDFVSEAACAELKRRAEALVDAFEPDEGVKSIFTTNEQTRHSDEYFLTSGDKTRFFFEEEAFDADGELRQAKALSINKLGHAMHDLDPVFERFSHTRRWRSCAPTSATRTRRSCSRCTSSSSPASVARSPATPT